MIPIIIGYVLIAFCCPCASTARPDPSYDCRQSDCKWLNPAAKSDQLSLVFLHNRKGSGTTFLNLARASQQLHPQANIRIISNEYECFNNLIHLIQNRKSRNYGLMLVTNFRDPIERIGSQAYYADGFAARLISDRYSACLNCTMDPQTAHCVSCRAEVEKAVIKELSVDAAPWMTWIKGRNGFKDVYLSNYFVLRLASGVQPNFLNKPNGESQMKNCLQFPEKPCRFPSLTKFIFNRICASKENRKASKAMLLSAQHMLETKFELYIMEHINEKCTLEYFTKILNFSSVSETERLLGAKTQRYHQGVRTFLYRDRMPPSVLAYLQRLNAYDIELYQFAENLFAKRLKEFGIKPCIEHVLNS